MLPNPVNFGDAARGQVRTVQATLRNNTDAPVTGLTARTDAPFLVDASDCRTVAAGADCRIEVSFAPSANGPASGTLQVASASGQEAQARLQGNGVDGLGDLDVSEGGGWNFGTWELGTTSTQKTLTLTNKGNGPIFISQIFVMDESSDFNLSHTCGDGLAPGATCTVTVSFSPTGLGKRLGAFRIRSQEGSVRDVWLLGFGGDPNAPEQAPEGRLSVTSSVNFGQVAVPSTGVAETVAVTNVGTTPVQLNAVTLTGDSASQFALANGCSQQVAPFASCTLEVTYQPTALGVHAASINLATGAPENDRTVSLSGRGTDAASSLRAAPTSVDFGSTTQGVPVERAVTLTNGGRDAVTVQATYTTSGSFAVVSGCEQALQSGGSCEVRVQFLAALPGMATGHLNVTTRDGQSLRVALSGMVSTPSLQLSTTSLSYGVLDVGQTSAPRKVVLTNSGTQTLALQNIALNGQPHFAMDNGCGSSLAPSASCEVGIVFSPAASGARSGSLVVGSNDPQGPYQVVRLDGFGQLGSLSVTPSSATFGRVELGQSATRNFTVANQGPGTAQVQSVQLVDGEDFEQTNTCSAVMGAGDECSVTVTFTPTKRATYNARLELTTSQGGALAVPLQGYGRSPAQGVLEVAPAEVSFGTTLTGTQTVRTATLMNTGTDALSIGGIIVEGTDAAAFQADQACLVELAPGARCGVTVTGRFDTARAYLANLRVVTQEGDTRDVPVVAVARDPVNAGFVSVLPDSLDFGSVDAGVPVARTARLTNTGTQAVVVSAASLSHSDFSVTQPCSGELAVGAECRITVEFKGAASLSGSMQVDVDNGQRLTVPLRAAVNAPRLLITPTALSFGQVEVSETSSARQVTLQNIGTSSLMLDAPFVQGDAGAEYALSSKCPAALPAGQSCVIDVTFAPLSQGSRPASLVVTSNNPDGSGVVTLSGEGRLQEGQGPVLSVLPSAVRFGSVDVGAVSTVRAVQVRNDGASLLRITEIGLADNSEFAQSNACGDTLAPQQTCEVSLTFAPAGGGVRETTLVLQSNDSAHPTAYVAVTGVGNVRADAVGELRFSPSTVVFDSLFVGKGASESNIVVTNVGAAAVDIDALGLTSTQGFSQNNSCGVTLLPGAQCSVVVAFEPPSVGGWTSAIQVLTRDGASYTVSLWGVALEQEVPPEEEEQPVDAPSFVLSHNSLNMGSLERGQVATRNVVLTNTGKVDLTVESVTFGAGTSADFQLGGTCQGPLAAGQTCTAEVVFRSADIGSHGGLVLFKAAGLDFRGVTLAANVVAPPGVLSVSTNAVDFGTTQLGGESTAQTVTLGNTGDSALALNALSLAGSFRQVSTTCGTMLAASQSCAIVLVHKPLAAGAQQGALTIRSNDRVNPAWTVALSGQTLSGELLFSEQSLNFGVVEVGQAQTRSVRLQNVGAGSFALSGLSVAGHSAASFALTHDCPAELASGASCAAGVTFTPRTAGAHSASLQVTPVFGEPLALSLVASGPAAHGELDLRSLAFEAQPLRVSSAPRTVKLTNVGTVPLAVYQVSIAAGESSFGVSHVCPPSLSPGQACDIAVSFTPVAAGALTGTLQVLTGSAEGTMNVELSGSGIAPTASVTPSAIDFGRVYAGQSQSRAVQVVNTSDIPLVVDAVGINEAATTKWFRAENTCGGPVLPGSSCDVLVHAAPNANSVRTGVLTLSTTAGVKTVQLTVEGASVSISSVRPDVLPTFEGTEVLVTGAGFGAESMVRFGDVAATSVTLVSPSQLIVRAPALSAGTHSVHIVDDGAVRATRTSAVRVIAEPILTSVAPNSGSVTGGWSAVLAGGNFVGTVTATVEGKAATVTRLTGDSVTITVPARATLAAGAVPVSVTTIAGTVTLPAGIQYVVPPASLTLSPGANFGNIAQGTSLVANFTLSNAGTGPVQVSGIAVANDSGNVFARSAGGTCPTSFPATLQPAEKCTLALSATGTNLGDAVGTMTVNLSAPQGEAPSFPLTARIVSPDFGLSSTPGTMTPASGVFDVVTAMSEAGGANGTVERTVYLNNTYRLGTSRVENAAVSIAGPSASQFQIVSVNAASNAGALRGIGAVISADGLSSSAASTDLGNGSYPHLAVTVRYRPSAAGDHNAQLSIAYNDGNSAGLPLFGQAQYYNKAALFAESGSNVAANGDFGLQPYNNPEVGSTGTTRTFFIRSVDARGKLLAVERMRILGADAGRFLISNYYLRSSGDSPSVDVTPTRLKQDVTERELWLTVEFKPSHPGKHEATLVIDSNSDAGQLVLPLSGEGVRDVVLTPSQGPDVVTITPYPMTGLGATSEKTFYLRNTGTMGQVRFSGMQIVGSPAFSFTDYGGARRAGNLSVLKPPAGSRYIDTPYVGADASSNGYRDLYASIKFSPSTVGTHEALVTVWHDGPGGVSTFTIRGEGARAVAELSDTNTSPVVQANGDFGAATFNGEGAAAQSVTKDLYVLNSTALGQFRVSRMQIVGDDAGAFRFVSYTGTTSASGQEVWPTAMAQSSPTTALSVRLAFAPVAQGAHSATLLVYHDAMNASPLSLPLTGFGANDVVLELSQAAGDAAVPIGPMPTTGVGTTGSKMVYLRAVGTRGSVTYTGFKVEGDSAFSVGSVALSNRAGARRALFSYPDGSRQESFEAVGADVGDLSARTDLNLGIAYMPTSAGAHTARITIFHNGPGGETSFDISGEAALGTLDVYMPLNGRDFTGAEEFVANLRNVTGLGAIPITGVRIEGKDAAAFTFSRYPGKPTGYVPSQTATGISCAATSAAYCEVYLTVAAPTRAGAYDASLVIEHGGVNGSPLTFPFSRVARGDVSWQFSGGPGVTTPTWGTVSSMKPETKTYYVRASGTLGTINFTSASTEFRSGFDIKAVRLAKRGGTEVGDPVEVSKTNSFVYFDVTTEDVGTDGYTDLAIDIEFTPTAGQQGQKQTIVRVGDAAGVAKSFTLVADVQIPTGELYSGSTAAMNTTFQGNSTITRTYYIRNTAGAGLLSVPEMRIEGPGAERFSISGWTRKSAEAAGTVVYPTALTQRTVSELLSVTVRYTGAAGLAPQLAQLQVLHNGSNASPMTLDLVGLSAAGTQTVTVDPFKAPDIGATLATGPNAILRATGTGQLVYYGYTISGSTAWSVQGVGLMQRGATSVRDEPLGPQFRLVTDELSAATPKSDLLLGLYFSPRGVKGTHTATVTVYHSKGTSVVQVTGNAR